MKFTNIMILLLGIFFIGFPQGAIAKKNHVPGKPFANLQGQIDDLQEQIDYLQEQIDYFGLTLEQQKTPDPAEQQGSAGILEKYMKATDGIPYNTSGRLIVYCDNIPEDVAISGNAHTYWDSPGLFQLSSYNDVLRPVCTYYGEDNPGPGLEAKTCQQGELPIGWQFIANPYTNNPIQHVVLNVMCIYAPDTQ